MFRQIGPPEIILILAVLVLLFGAKKLPELARGSGRALRIFKAETKGLIDHDEDSTKSGDTATADSTTATRELEGSGEQVKQPEPERSRDTAD